MVELHENEWRSSEHLSRYLFVMPYASYESADV